ncbi:eukaryotic translation initiation factor 3, gamma subunit [Massarina eburnea CBS 473.64]|uniref:tRNA (adenine(58)-N(1))-methyltransferase non-catalytic subunit TRM6 n=1 Tax=Massarina eburnea CBS 473.64 TaxID=1395130 RepID=A0A6A6RXJ6_9PLEO|nr:eukaryotic translation initiation factor 3, gamma subunit [Massarina eburnea CBS 473.64]
MHSYVRPNTHIALRLPSGQLKIVEIAPNTNINLGKYGTFSSNQILGRPYYLTFELLDKDDGKSSPELRVVPASELHAEALGSDYAPPAEATDESVPAEGATGFDIVGEDGEVIMRNNRLTVDDPSRQTLSMEEIEELKKAGAGSGKDIIARIMASHMGIEEKTQFSLAKYTLRKSRKYMKRFTVLPLDIGMLTEYVTEKEAYKIMELREETLGLICSWANVHCASSSRILTAEDGVSQIGGGRWLVVDDTGGLVTAAMAEKMGILYPPTEEEMEGSEEAEEAATEAAPQEATLTTNVPTETTETVESNGTQDVMVADTEAGAASTTQNPPAETSEPRPSTRKPRQHIPQMSAQANTLTVLHPNNQPNISHLKYFGFDTGNPVPTHPLYTHLKSVSWLQLLHPEEDPSYIEPETLTDDALANLKSSKRGNYYKKRRRWEKTKRVVDETRAGGFDGLVIATGMETKTILKEVIPLVRGGGKIVVYSPNAEPLVELCDYYSKDRRAAYIAREFGPQQNGTSKKMKTEPEDDEDDEGTNSTENGDDDDDFPVNPTLLLAPSVQTARARHWQVLPQRTHPFMTSRGGAEGYLFTATRVLPVEGKVEARGHGRGKKRKVGPDAAVPS